MPDKWGRSTGSEIVDRALWRLQRWIDPASGSTLSRQKIQNKVAAARLIGARDKDIALVLDITQKQLRDLMEE